MGNNISKVEDKFFIPQQNKAPALAAAKALNVRGMPYAPEMYACETLEAAFREWGYPVKTNEDGDIIKINCDSEKLGSEEELFKSIAPFVLAGSFIHMSDDHGGFRWTFDGATCKRQSPKWDE
jgi:hypothetical protein